MSVALTCSSCGTDNPAGARFCMGCGTALEHALRRLGAEVERYGGSVDKYIGDNVMAVFGAPVAHEDDAERAVRAGLGMQRAMAEINQGLPDGVAFELRVGINTGEVLAGAVGDAYTVVGDTVNVASRLQSVARPGSVTVAERTARATRDAVRYEPLAPLELKGRAERVSAWEAVGLIAEHALRRVRSSQAAPLVGRDREIATLVDLYERVVREGRPRLVTVIGEAGGGKLGREGPGEPPERRAAIIARSLGLEAPAELLPAGADDPERAPEAFFSALRGVVEAAPRRRPLVLAFEDIHWADDGMLDAIEHLAQWVHAPLMLVSLARDELLERRPAWAAGRHDATRLFLEPLADQDVRELVSALLPRGEESVASMIAERSGGNPLFAEEMVRRISEEGTMDAVRLPDTVQAVLAARLDALAPFERRLVQQAAVVGQTFPASSLATLIQTADVDLALSSLREKDILVPAEGASDERELGFKHVLIRDVAYAMLPKAVRCRKHFEVGRFIEERAGDRTDEVVAVLAEHYGRAAALGLEAGVDQAELAAVRERALRFLEEAGDAAARLYANREALSHYRHARKIEADGDPDTLARIGEKVGDVSLRLGRVDEAVAGWEGCLPHHRGQEQLERVADLHRKIGSGLSHKGERRAAIEHYQKGINLLKDGPPRLELVRLYEEAAWLYLHTGDNMLAIYASEKALRLAERLGEVSAASRAHGIFGRVFGRIGDTEKARSNLERSVDLARGSDDQETILALLALGRHLELSEADPDAAERAFAEALRLAQEVGDLPSQVQLHAALGQLAAYRAQWDRVAESTEASAGLAEREGLVGKLCLPYALRGLLRWREGDLAEAERLFGEAHELAERVGWSELAFQALYGLAVALRDRGELTAATQALDRAVDLCERAGLLAQSIQAGAARAIVLELSGRREAARESATEAAELAERLHYPLARAAALEARGATAEDPEDGARLLRDAESAWAAFSRPLEAARCRVLAGRVLLARDPERARRLIEEGAETAVRLGVPHLAEGVGASAG